MAPKKAAAKKTTRVSPSARGEGSRAKPVAKRVSPSKRGEGSSNAKGTVAMKKKTAKVQEAGVANVAGSLVKGAVAVGKKIKSQTPKAKAAAKKKKEAAGKAYADRYAKSVREAEARRIKTMKDNEKERLRNQEQARAERKKLLEQREREANMRNFGNTAGYAGRPKKTYGQPYTDQFGNTGWR